MKNNMKILIITVMCLIFLCLGCVDRGNNTSLASDTNLSNDSSLDTEISLENGSYSTSFDIIGNSTITNLNDEIKYQLTIKNIGDSEIEGLYIIPYSAFIDNNKTTLKKLSIGETITFNGVYKFNDVDLDYSKSNTLKEDKVDCCIVANNADMTKLSINVYANITNPINYKQELEYGNVLNIENNIDAVDATNAEVWKFLREHNVKDFSNGYIDKNYIETEEFNLDKYLHDKPLHYANQVHNDAEKNGIRAGCVDITFYDTINKEEFHQVFNVFDTTNNGRIFTFSEIIYNKQYDFPVKLVKGEQYEFHRTITDYTDDEYLIYNSVDGIIVKDYKIYW